MTGKFFYCKNSERMRKKFLTHGPFFSFAAFSRFFSTVGPSNTEPTIAQIPAPRLDPKYARHDVNFSPDEPGSSRTPSPEEYAKYMKDRSAVLKVECLNYYFDLEDLKIDLHNFYAQRVRDELDYDPSGDRLFIIKAQRIEQVKSRERVRRESMDSADLRITEIWDKQARVILQAELRSARPKKYGRRWWHGKSLRIKSYHSFYQILSGGFWDRRESGDHRDPNRVTPFQAVFGHIIFRKLFFAKSSRLPYDQYGTLNLFNWRETELLWYTFPSFDLIFLDRDYVYYFAKWFQWWYHNYVRIWSIGYYKSYEPTYCGGLGTLEDCRLDWSLYRSLPLVVRLCRSFWVHFDIFPITIFAISGFIFFYLIYYIPLYFFFNFFFFLKKFLERVSLFYLGWAALDDLDRLPTLPTSANRNYQTSAEAPRLLSHFQYKVLPSPSVDSFHVWLWERIAAEYSYARDERISTYFFNPYHEEFYYEYYPFPVDQDPLSYWYCRINPTDGDVFYIPSRKKPIFDFIVGDLLIPFFRWPIIRFDAWLSEQDWVNYATVLLRSQSIKDRRIEARVWSSFLSKRIVDKDEFLFFEGDEEAYRKEERMLQLSKLAYLWFVYLWFVIRLFAFVFFGPLILLFFWFEKRLGFFAQFIQTFSYACYFSFNISPVIIVVWAHTRIFSPFRAWLKIPVIKLTRSFRRKFNKVYPFTFKPIFRWFFFVPLEMFACVLSILFIYVFFFPVIILFGSRSMQIFYQFFSFTTIYKGVPFRPNSNDYSYPTSRLKQVDDNTGFTKHPERDYYAQIAYFEEDGPNQVFSFQQYDEGYDSGFFKFLIPRTRSRFYYLTNDQYEKNYASVPRFSIPLVTSLLYRFRARREFFKFLYSPKKIKPSNSFSSWALAFFLFFTNVFFFFFLRPLLFLSINLFYYCFLPCLFFYLSTFITPESILVFFYSPYFPGYLFPTIAVVTSRYMFFSLSFFLIWFFFPPLRLFIGDRHTMTLFQSSLFCHWYMVMFDSNLSSIVPPGLKPRVRWWGWPWPPPPDISHGAGFFPGLLFFFFFVIKNFDFFRNLKRKYF